MKQICTDTDYKASAFIFVIIGKLDAIMNLQNFNKSLFCQGGGKWTFVSTLHALQLSQFSLQGCQAGSH